MRSPEEVAREILDAMWERVGNEGFDEDATTPALVRIIRARDAEVRADKIAAAYQRSLDDQSNQPVD